MENFLLLKVCLMLAWYCYLIPSSLVHNKSKKKKKFYHYLIPSFHISLSLNF